METLFTPLYNLKLAMHQVEYLLERGLKVFAEIDTLTPIYLCRGYASPWNAASFKLRTFQNLLLHQFTCVLIKITDFANMPTHNDNTINACCS
uniref:Uncharacterized protein n=1 Tax=Anguilla anguilla TaxID=7936 RepID=A0A0E9WY53_ANGAN